MQNQNKKWDIGEHRRNLTEEQALAEAKKGQLTRNEKNCNPRAVSFREVLKTAMNDVLIAYQDGNYNMKQLLARKLIALVASDDLKPTELIKLAEFFDKITSDERQNTSNDTTLESRIRKILTENSESDY